MEHKGKNYKTIVIIATTLTLAAASIYGVFALDSPGDDLIHEVTSDDLGNEYEVIIEDGKANYTKIGTSTNLQVIEKLGNKTVEYTNSGSTLILKETPTESTEKLVAPGGELLTGKRNGRNIYEHQGLDKEQLEEKKDTLREKMEEDLATLEDEKKEVIRKHLPDIEIAVNNQDSEDTFFEITNNGEEPINLANWKLEGLESETDSRDAEHLFESQTLGEGDTLKVYTEDDNQIGEEDNYVVADEMTIYSSQTDTVVLYNDFGEEITETTYNQ